EVFREIVEYLKEEWLEDETARKFLHCYTKFYKHFGNSATSRAEGGHWMLKKDLGVSTNDLLTAIQSFERTIIYQHNRIKQKIEDERVSKPAETRNPDTSTRRDLSAFEVVLSQETQHRRGRGRGHGRSQGAEHEANQGNSQGPAQRGGARAGRGRRRGRTGGDVDGVPTNMTGVIEF
ncbi:hypothetical protein Egran_06282, partial [Elaphomyces granulatus]